MNLLQFFKDGDGQYSAMRLGFLLWVLGLLGIWGYVCVSKQAIVAIDPTVLTLLGILTGGKVVQSATENLGGK